MRWVSQFVGLKFEVFLETPKLGGVAEQIPAPILSLHRTHNPSSPDVLGPSATYKPIRPVAKNCC